MVVYGTLLTGLMLKLSTEGQGARLFKDAPNDLLLYYELNVKIRKVN